MIMVILVIMIMITWWYWLPAWVRPLLASLCCRCSAPSRWRGRTPEMINKIIVTKWSGITSQFNKRLGPMCWKSAFAMGPLTTPRLQRKINLFMSAKLSSCQLNLFHIHATVNVCRSVWEDWKKCRFDCFWQLLLIQHPTCIIPDLTLHQLILEYTVHPSLEMDWFIIIMTFDHMWPTVFNFWILL